MAKMGRPPKDNPRREKVATYLTKEERFLLKKTLDKIYPRLSISDALREIVLEWVAKNDDRGWSAPAEIQSYTNARTTHAAHPRKVK